MLLSEVPWIEVLARRNLSRFTNRYLTKLSAEQYLHSSNQRYCMFVTTRSRIRWDDAFNQQCFFVCLAACGQGRNPRRPLRLKQLDA